MPSTAEDSEVGKLFETIGDALLQAENSANAILDELFVDSTGVFLEDWSRVLGFPRCGITTLTAQEQRDANLAWLNISKVSTKAFFVDIAAVMGFTITVEDKNDDITLGAFEWRVSSLLDAPIASGYFRTGESRCGEALSGVASADALKCIMLFFAPAHTTIYFQVLIPFQVTEGNFVVTGDELFLYVNA